MKRYVRTAVAFVLCLLGLAIGQLCWARLAPLVQDGYYEGYGCDNVLAVAYEQLLFEQSYHLELYADPATASGVRVTEQGLDPNVWYTISKNGRELARGGSADPHLRSTASCAAKIVDARSIGDAPYLVTFYLVERADFVNSELSRSVEQVEGRMANADGYLAGAVLGWLLCLSCLVLLVVGSVRRARAGTQYDFDRAVPADACLVLFLLAAVLTCEALPAGELWTRMSFLLLHDAIMLLYAACALALGLSLARRLPCGRWREGLLIKRLWAMLGTTVHFAVARLPLLGRTITVFVILSVLEGICSMVFLDGGLVFWCLIRLVEFSVVVYAVVYWRILQESTHELAAGDLTCRVPVEELRGPFRAMGEDLSAIRGGIEKAVEEQLRSERMKTELITNVSHDIKTPLTSIVNYVDLLSKEELPNGPAREYVAVLVRQADRLKKLTEDLVEASKASTGSLEVDLRRTDVNVLLSQSAAEYADRLRAQDLTLVLRPAEGEALVLADGRLLWRIFENLLGNIVKYALPGTRVYLSCTAQERQVQIVFRNISREPLDVPPEELIERFVRGDAARSTEGSGLGLAIANSLTGLQHGTFALDLDGDLFKVTLTFPRLTEDDGRND